MSGVLAALESDLREAKDAQDAAKAAWEEVLMYCGESTLSQTSGTCSGAGS